MIRILHIVHILSCGGGLSNLVMNYYRQMDRTKIQFDFLYFKEVEEDFKEEITALGGRYFSMPQPFLTATSEREIDGFFKTHQGEYRAIHCHALFAVAFFAKSARKHGIEHIIAHSHSTEYGARTLQKCRNWMLVRLAARWSTHKVACSKAAARFMFGKRSVEAGEVLILNNAIDVRQFAFCEANRKAVREEYGLRDEFVLLHAGSFSVTKNHAFLIDVFEAFLKIRPNSVLMLLGGASANVGSTLDGIKEKVRALGIEDKVVFLGIRKDVGRFLSAADAFVFPSRFEGFGIALLEAQAAGLWCFASDTVPLETCLSDKTLYISLKQPADDWAKQIAAKTKLGPYDRSIDLERFAPYGIAYTSQALAQLYLSL